MNSTEALERAMGQRIAEKRKELGLSQEQLSEKSSVSVHTISSAERGLKCLRCDSLVKICTALGVSADYLLTGLVTDSEYSLIINRLKNATDKQRKDTLEIINILLS